MKNRTLFLFCLIIVSCNSNNKTDSINTTNFTETAENNIKPIKIGSLTWMNENLNVTTFANGDNIFEVKSEKEWKEAEINKQPCFSYYMNDPKYKSYGLYYNYYAIIDKRNLAPKGWRIATDEDWSNLFKSLGYNPVYNSNVFYSGRVTFSEDGGERDYEQEKREQIRYDNYLRRRRDDSTFQMIWKRYICTDETIWNKLKSRETWDKEENGDTNSGTDIFGFSALASGQRKGEYYGSEFKTIYTGIGKSAKWWVVNTRKDLVPSDVLITGIGGLYQIPSESTFKEEYYYQLPVRCVRNN